jgi:hypothetical protein
MNHNLYCLLLLLLIIPNVNAQSIVKLKDLKLNFGGDAYIRGYSNKVNSNSKSQGFGQMLRLKLDITTSENISIRTRTILSGDKWNGDTAGQSVSGNTSGSLDGGNPVRLDYGYIEVPMAKGWTARAGRQTANFSDCFNTCDDRRDRLMAYKFYGNFMPAILYDKRAENTINKEGDDADMYAAALFHIHKVHEWALLYATWFNDDNSYVLNKVHNFSPYYKYKSEKVTGLLVWNWLGQGDNNSWYSGHHNSFAAKLEYRPNHHFDISFQAILSEDGGLIAGGYDTYSFVVNNDRDNNRSNTRLVSLGGLGTFTGGSSDDEHFFVTRFRYINGKFKAAMAVGKAREYVNPLEQDLMIYDLQFHYQYTKSLLLKAGIALVRNDRSEEASLFQMETTF